MNQQTLMGAAGKVFDFNKLKTFFVEKNGKAVIPAIIQDFMTKEVLIPGFTDLGGVIKTLQTGIVTLWSTSRNEEWTKGLTSGSYMELIEARINCDNNAVLYLVRPRAGACHKKDAAGDFYHSCFFREIKIGKNGITFSPLRKKRRKSKMEKNVLAIPSKSSSLNEKTMLLLNKLCLAVKASDRKAGGGLEGLPFFDQFIFLRPQAIPEAVRCGLALAGITGLDTVRESGYEDELVILTELNYARSSNRSAKLVIFGRSGNENSLYSSGKKFLTEYPNIIRKYFPEADITFSYGATEALVAQKLYDFGVGIVETGVSLKENGLQVLRVLFVSPVVLIARYKSPELDFFGRLLQGVLRAENYQLLKANVSKENLARTLVMLPALEAPTVNTLSDGCFQVETVVAKEILSDILLKLMAAGAKDILVQDINVVL